MKYGSDVTSGESFFISCLPVRNSMKEWRMERKLRSMNTMRHFYIQSTRKTRKRILV